MLLTGYILTEVYRIKLIYLPLTTIENNDMKAKIMMICLAILALSCESRQYFIAESDNPVYKPNMVFQTMEDLTNPGFKNLIEKYQLDTIFHGESDEFNRILLLRHWIKTVIKINDYGDPYPGGGYAERILDAALEGQGFHCGHFRVVQNGVMNAYGYLTRALGAGPGVQGVEGSDGHHGINEVWINKFNKWVLFDAKYDHHFEKNGIPLSSLEIRDEYLKNKGADILLVQGLERKSIDYNEEVQTSKESFTRTYTWITWQENGDFFSAWPDHKGKVVMHEDEFYTNNIWFRDGKPCWIYDHMEEIRLIRERDQIEWTPNTIKTEVKIEGSSAIIKLVSDTPNLKEYQVRESSSGDWSTTGENFSLDLKNKKYELAFRVVNLADVTGPEHRVIIDSE
jgi:hypothetical protein